MTENDNWVTHWRQIGAGVVPPTPADPRAMAAVAVRRTRVRRAVVAGGSVTGIVAMVAGTAFAMGGVGQAPEVLPGAPTASATEARSADPAAAHVPEGWHSERLRDLSYALPPELVTNGPNPDEPGSESLTWHDRRDEDRPPYVHVQVVTPGYAFYDTDATGLSSTPGADAEPFDLEGASLATVEDSTGGLLAAAGHPTGDDAAGILDPVDPDAARIVRVIVHPAGSEERYVIHLNLPAGSEELLDGFQGSLRIG